MANELLTRTLMVNALLDRYFGAGVSFSTHEGNRDMYLVLGYPNDLDYDYYLDRYTRQDIASRIVESAPEATWADDPIIYDGKPPALHTFELQGTEFERAFLHLCKRLPIISRIERGDIVSGIGDFGILLIGLKDGRDLDQPVGFIRSPDDIAYLTPYRAGSIDIKEWDDNTASERYGQPVLYTVSINDGKGGEQAVEIHWSRIIHLAEDSDDGIIGRPRLQGVINRLIDLEKLVGGGSEATWKLMDKGYTFDVSPEFSLDEEDEEKMLTQIQEFEHGLRRILLTRGVNVSQLGSDVVDPTGLFDIILSLISAHTNIPKRMLVGSERGELASSQDEKNWAKVINRRRTRYAEPFILRPFIDRLILIGALPQPINGEYDIAWRPVIDLTEVDQARVTSSVAASIASVAQSPNIITSQEFRKIFLRIPAEPEEGMGELREDQSQLPEQDGTYQAKPQSVADRQVQGRYVSNINELLALFEQDARSESS